METPIYAASGELVPDAAWLLGDGTSPLHAARFLYTILIYACRAHVILLTILEKFARLFGEQHLLLLFQPS
jgi:hypothetical protein